VVPSLLLIRSVQVSVLNSVTSAPLIHVEDGGRYNSDIRA
jgi:hypothetical protein